MSDVKIIYHGFHPSTFTKNYLKIMFDKLASFAPHRSFLNAHFSKQDKIFKGFVQIFSYQGQFYASASGNRLRDVIKLLMIQLKKKMNKKKRNSHTSFLDLSLLEEDFTTEMEKEYHKIWGWFLC